MGDTKDQDYKPVVDDEEEEEFAEENTADNAESTSKKRQREEAEPDVQRDAEGNAFFPLSSKRRLTIRSFKNGELFIDIREFFQDKNTQELRHGKGIALPMAQWKQLIELAPSIQQVIDSASSSKPKKQK